VTGVTGKAVYRKNSVTAVTSVTRKSKTRYLITDPTFSNFTIKYRYPIHSIRRDRRIIAGLFLCKKTNRRNEKWKIILTQADLLREPSEVYIRRRCRSKHRVWMYTSQTPCQGRSRLSARSVLLKAHAFNGLHRRPAPPETPSKQKKRKEETQ